MNRPVAVETLARSHGGPETGAGQAQDGPKWSWLSSSWALGLITAVVALGIAAVVFRLWDTGLRTPLAYGEDAMSHAMHVKGIIENGWYYDNPALGAPFGHALYDFPLGGEHLQLVLLKLLGFVLGEAVLTVNVYYLLTFPLAAVSAMLVLRWLGVRRSTAVVFGTLYAFLPYHFARGSRHLFLSGYYLVPLGLYLALAVLSGQRLFQQRERGAHGRSLLVRYASPRSLAILLACVVLGSTSTYYTCFSALLIAVAGGLRALRERSAGPLAPAAALVLVIFGALALNNAPTALYRTSHGENAEVAHRDPAEADYFGLKIAQLVLPAEGHRVPALAELSKRYRESTYIPSERGQSLGILGTIGLLWLGWVGVRGLLGRAPRPDDNPTFNHLSLLAAAGIFAATVGGLAALFNTFVSAQIRSWNRMSVFIGFLALASVALLLDGARQRLQLHRRRVAVLGLISLLLFGVLDQVAPGALPDHERLAAEYSSDAAFVAGIERSLPAGAMVFQLPYRPFPEVGRLERAIDYDHFRGYLHSTDLRWSYGGLKGRQADWQEQLRGQPTDLLVARLVPIGFGGIWVDRFAYADEGRSIESGLVDVVGSPALISRNGRFSFFSLKDAALQLRSRVPAAELDVLADTTLHPVRSRWGAGFGAMEEEHDDWWLDAGAKAAIDLENPGSTPRDVVVDLTLQAIGPEARHVDLRRPDGQIENLDVSAGSGSVLHRVVTVPPGHSTLTLTLRDPGPLSPDATPLRIFRPSVYEPSASGLR